QAGGDGDLVLRRPVVRNQAGEERAGGDGVGGGGGGQILVVVGGRRLVVQLPGPGQGGRVRRVLGVRPGDVQHPQVDRQREEREDRNDDDGQERGDRPGAGGGSAGHGNPRVRATGETGRRKRVSPRRSSRR